MSEETAEVEKAEEPVPETPRQGEISRLRQRKNLQHRKTLGARIDRVYQFAKSKGLQVLIFGEGMAPGEVSMGGWYTNELLKSLIMNVRIKWPQIMESALRELDEIAARAQAHIDATKPAAEPVPSSEQTTTANDERNDPDPSTEDAG